MLKEITSFSGENSVFSNFYECPIMFEGKEYGSTEAAFQSYKSQTPSIREQIRIMTPSQAKKAGKPPSRGGLVHDIRPDWDEIKDELMLNLVRTKFNSNEYLKQRLIATGDAKLIEGNTWRDTYWGVCNGRGKNKLGRILMQVRFELVNNTYIQGLQF